jgi:hypothetical protein
VQYHPSACFQQVIHGFDTTVSNSGWPLSGPSSGGSGKENTRRQMALYISRAFSCSTTPQQQQPESAGMY